MTNQFSIRRVSLLLGLALFIAVAVLEPSEVYSNIYELLLVTVLTAIYWFLRSRQSVQSVSFLAMVSITTAVLNPAATHIVFKLAGLPWVGRGDSELRSFACGLLAVITGHVALIRIRRANPSVRGRGIAWVGIVIGYLWLVGWLSFYFYFAWAMSHWK